MSTPPNERPPPEQDPEHTEAERKSASPLVWLILLIALAAIAWYFASQRDTADVPLDPVAPVEEVQDEDAAAADDQSPAAAPAAEEPAPAAPAPADRAAEPAARVQPTYPAAALRSREEGTVLLRVEVDAQGNPTSVEVENSSRSRELDRAARDAVRQWSFSPAIENGQPVASTVTVPVDFRVEEE